MSKFNKPVLERRIDSNRVLTIGPAPKRGGMFKGYALYVEANGETKNVTPDKYLFPIGEAIRLLEKYDLTALGKGAGENE